MMYLSLENIRLFNISFFKKSNFLTYKISYKIKILANLLIKIHHFVRNLISFKNLFFFFFKFFLDFLKNLKNKKNLTDLLI
jgi:hypothetical protein